MLNYVGYRLLDILSTLLSVYMWVFVADAVLSWFLPHDHPIRRFTIFLTEPLVSVFRPLAMKLLSKSMIPISLGHLFAYLFLLLVRFGINRLMIFLYF